MDHGHGGRLRRFYFYFCIFISSIGTFSYADVYPWVWMSSQDLKIITDSKVEAEFRLQLIRRAKVSLDIVTFDQRSDEKVGMPMLRAVKEAARRGVKVRFLTAWLGHILKEPFNRNERYLKSNNGYIQNPLDFRVIGGRSLTSNGWGYMDSIHEKLLIVDNKVAIVTGRGYSNEYLPWMDTAFVFKGPLVFQAALAFDDLWTTTSIESGRSTETASIQNEADRLTFGSLSDHFPLGPPAPLNPLSAEMSERKIREAHDLTIWSEEPPVDDRLGPENERLKARLLHHDLFRQLRAAADREGISPRDYAVEGKLDRVQDPILEEFMRLLTNDDVRDVRFFSLSATMAPRLKTAIMDAQRRGVDVTMFTNSRTSNCAFPIPGLPVGWLVSLPDLDDLLQSGVSIFGLAAPTNSSCPIYVHRKLAIVGETVFFGSHNLNISSSIQSDEMSFEIQGSAFSEQVRELFDQSVEAHGERLDPGAIHQENGSTWFKQKICGLLKCIY